MFIYQLHLITLWPKKEIYKLFTSATEIKNMEDLKWWGQTSPLLYWNTPYDTCCHEPSSFILLRAYKLVWLEPVQQLSDSYWGAQSIFLCLECRILE